MFNLIISISIHQLFQVFIMLIVIIVSYSSNSIVLNDHDFVIYSSLAKFRVYKARNL